MTDPRADIRSAIRRLTAAAYRIDTVDVTVQRRDIEVLLAAVTANRRQADVVPPVLHPAQR